MIPCTQPLNAVFLTPAAVGAEPHVTERPVLAFDVAGGPLIAGDDRLIPAAKVKGFTRIQPASTPATDEVIGTIPGGGWCVEYTNADGAVWTRPLIAWTVTNDGTVRPCQTSTEPECVSALVYHPDHQASPKPAWTAPTA